MQGLEIAERYFWRYGAPMLEQHFARYVPRIAAGLVGEGSECYGFDDEISRDHDWGAGFCLWLTPQDYATIGPALTRQVSELPGDAELGSPRPLNVWGSQRVGVFEIGAFYRTFIGLDHAPANLHEWRAIPESSLSVCTNGKVFADPLGEFSRFRQALLDYYPEDVRLKKIASRCMTLAQLGQYNFTRCVERKEPVAAQYVQAQFCAHVLSLVFMLNRQYVPFYKWMHRAVRPLPILGDATYALLSEIAASYGALKKQRLLQEACALITGELVRQGLSDATSNSLQDHALAVQSRIKDARLRNADVRSD